MSDQNIARMFHASAKDSKDYLNLGMGDDETSVPLPWWNDGYHGFCEITSDGAADDHFGSKESLDERCWHDGYFGFSDEITDDNFKSKSTPN